MIVFLLLVFTPIGISAARYFLSKTCAAPGKPPIVPARDFCPRRAIIAKPSCASTPRGPCVGRAFSRSIAGSWSRKKAPPRYTRYDYTAWGDPIRSNGFAPDARWFGAVPETVVAVDGEKAGLLIPRIRQVIETYKFRAYGDYSAWPGPNSNTFVQAVLNAVPELNAVLPPTAIGKDFLTRAVGSD